MCLFIFLEDLGVPEVLRLGGYKKWRVKVNVSRVPEELVKNVAVFPPSVYENKTLKTIWVLIGSLFPHSSHNSIIWWYFI